MALFNCSTCNPSYEWTSYSETQCYRIDTTGSTAPVFTLPAVDKNYIDYSIFGTRFYDFGFNLNGTGTILTTSTFVNVWKSNNPTNGPMNRCSIWTTTSFIGLPYKKWLGFSKCFTITENKTYYFGVAADNDFRAVLDGIEILNTFGGPYDNSPYAFKYWHIYPINLSAGYHILELYGLNQGADGAFGCTIYDNTLSELTGATSVSQLNEILTSSGQTTIELVQDLNNNYLTSGYTCPEGYRFACGECTQFIYCDKGDIPPNPPFPPVTPVPPAYPPVLTNECGVSTVLSMVAECSVIQQPTTQSSYDGSLSVSVLGGTTPYIITWSNGVVESSISGSTITNLNAGTYTATIVDYWGDFSSTTICTLLPQTTTTTSTTTTTTEKPYSSEFCMTVIQNETSSKINFIYNGLVNGQHSWISDDPVGYTITGNTSGTQWRVDGFTSPAYGITNTEPPSSTWTTLGFGKFVSITTADGPCNPLIITSPKYSIVSPNNPFNLKVNKNEPLCGCDGAITILATNGNPPYSYSVDNGVTYKNSPFFTNLCNGLYTISVIDFSGNVSNSSISLSTPPLPTLYSLSLNKKQRVVSNNGITKSYTTDVLVTVDPPLPSTAFITFDLIHTNSFKCSPVFSAASVSTNTTLTENLSPISFTTSGQSTGTTINTYPGCQDQNIFLTTYSEIWEGLVISSIDTIELSTNSSITQNVSIGCYFGEVLDTYSVSNLKINNCSCCSVRNI